MDLSSATISLYVRLLFSFLSIMIFSEAILKGYESKELALTVKQLETLQDIHKKLTALPDDTDKFVEWATKEFKDAVPNFNLKNYDL